MPLVTYYYVYTKAHWLEQESANVPRTGIFAAWHAAYGQADETKVYKQANVESTAMIAKGHCQARILLAWCADAAILSDTYTFNAGMEYQGQNIGTEIATENYAVNSPIEPTACASGVALTAALPLIPKEK